MLHPIISIVNNNDNSYIENMKIAIPIIGNRYGMPVIDDFFDNICRVANINTRIIIGCPSNNKEDNTKPFILVKDNMVIKKKYENVPKEILKIYPNRSNKVLTYYFEVYINDDRLDLLTEDELKLGTE